MEAAESDEAHVTLSDSDVGFKDKARPGRDLPRPRRIWGFALAAGVTVGIVSGLLGELALGAFKPRLIKVQILLQEFIQPTTESQIAADVKNSTLSIVLLGFIAAFGLGLAGGLASRSPTRGVLAGLATGSLGAMTGFLAAWRLLPLFHRQIVPDPNDLYTPMLLHGVMWASVGAVAGAAFSIGLGEVRRLPKAILGASIGAVLATLVFHAIGESLFPEAGFTQMVAESPYVRLLARFLFGVLIAAGAARGVQGLVTHHPRPDVPVSAA